MNLKEAKTHVGKLVISHDAGCKLIQSVLIPHGPYKLLQVTKGGLAILEGREEFRIRPSTIEPFNEL